MLFYNPLKTVSPFVYRLAGMSKYLPQTKDYYERVTLDLGTVRYLDDVNDIYKFLKDESLDTDTKLLWFGDAGIKTRVTTVSGTPLTFVSKGYSLDPTPNDLTQTTELNQPYLSGNIAPNERYALKNPSNVLRYIAHPTITLAADYTLTFVLKYDKANHQIAHITGADSGFNTGYGLNGFANENLFSFGAVNTPISNIELFGKVKTLHIVRVGDIHNFYIDGILAGTYTSSIRYNFARLFSGRTSGRYCNNTNIHYYRIQSGAMTAPQVAAEHAMLRSIYPEIESVQIGTQTWATSNLEMVATPMGNVIPEVTDNAAWANATTLYNDAIAGGATEANAVKAAAMWCYYNNDPNIGAIMGKLYNKYAAKLLLNDITAYNVANPTAHWGWNVPTRAQLTTLSAQGGNASKVGGTDYWTTANGSNSNGLTLLGSGYRQGDGTFADLKATTGLLCNDADFVRQVINADNSFDEAAITTEGYPIRLIKDE